MSLTQQIRDVLAVSDALTAAELAERCSEAADTTQVAGACHAMVERGEITRHKPPEGGRYRYTLAAGAPARDDDEPPPKDASEARTSRVTPSRKSNGTGPARLAQARRARRSTALLPVTGKAPSARPGPPATRPVEADLQIAITDQGVLALRRGDAVMFLSPEERARLDAFTARFTA